MEINQQRQLLREKNGFNSMSKTLRFFLQTVKRNNKVILKTGVEPRVSKEDPKQTSPISSNSLAKGNSQKNYDSQKSHNKHNLRAHIRISRAFISM